MTKNGIVLQDPSTPAKITVLMWCWWSPLSEKWCNVKAAVGKLLTADTNYNRSRAVVRPAAGRRGEHLYFSNFVKISGAFQQHIFILFPPDLIHSVEYVRDRVMNPNPERSRRRRWRRRRCLSAAMTHRGHTPVCRSETLTSASSVTLLRRSAV